MSRYSLPIAIALDVIMMIGWSWLLLRTIPAGTPVTPSGEVFITVIPLLMLEGILNTIAIVLTLQGMIIRNSQRLRADLLAERGSRVADMAQTVLDRLDERTERRQENG